MEAVEDMKKSSELKDKEHKDSTNSKESVICRWREVQAEGITTLKLQNQEELTNYKES